jgi:transcriptional regulator with XRE-family HTH domain
MKRQRKPLAKKIGERLDAEIKKAGLSREMAARKLEISRQQLQDYIGGYSYPGADVLCKAFAAWPKLFIDCDDTHRIYVTVSGKPKRPPKRGSFQQLTLPLTCDVTPMDLAVTVGKKRPQRVHLEVSVKVQK